MTLTNYHHRQVPGDRLQQEVQHRRRQHAHLPPRKVQGRLPGAGGEELSHILPG